MAVKAYSGTYTWEEARTKCSQDGIDVKAELPAPRGSIENKFYVDVAKGYGIALGSDKFWLGVNDIDVADEYTDQNGNPHTYFSWANSQPESHAQRCVQAGGFQGYNWHDIMCTDAKSLLCVVGKAVISNQIQTKRIIFS